MHVHFPPRIYMFLIVYFVSLLFRVASIKFGAPPTNSSPQHYKLMKENQSRKKLVLITVTTVSQIWMCLPTLRSTQRWLKNVLHRRVRRPGVSIKKKVSLVSTFSVREKHSSSYVQDGDSALHIEEGDDIDCDNNFESSRESEVDHLSDSNRESDDEVEDKEPGYSPWTSFAASSHPSKKWQSHFPMFITFLFPCYLGPVIPGRRGISPSPSAEETPWTGGEMRRVCLLSCPAPQTEKDSKQLSSSWTDRKIAGCYSV